MSWVRRRIVFPLILAAALALMTALLFEVVIRVAAPFSPFVRLLTRTEAAGPRPDSLAEFLDLHGVGLEPGRVMGGRFRNSLGLPSREPAEQSGVRIVAIGDSFVVNDYPVPWMWPYLLQERLAGPVSDASVDEEATDRAPGESVEVLTFALPGIGPVDYESLWDLAGRSVEPDLVLVSFFVGNDFQNFRELRDEAPPRWRTALFLGNFWRFLRNRATRNEGALPKRADPPRERSGQLGAVVAGYEQSFDNQQATLAEGYYRALKSEVLNIFSVANEDLLQTEVLHVAEVLARTCTKAEQAGAECLVVVFPDELQVEAELRDALIAALERGAETFDFDRPSEMLASRLGALEVKVFDLLPCLRGADRSLYRLRDTHLNRRGNQQAANCLAEHLIRSRAAGLPDVASLPVP